jgi:hypothetical protein
MIRTIVLLVVAATALVAQDAANDANAPDTKPPDLSPAELVRLAVANEVAAAQQTNVLHLFRSRKETAKGSQTRLYVETQDSLAAMLIAINDQPLTAEQQQDETNHLTWLENNPDQLRKKRAREKEDEERSLRIVKALPGAFHYQFVGWKNGEPGLGKPGDHLARLKFTPNPNYSPPSRVEEVLAGMEGEVLVDTDCKRLARIDGTLFRDISFGWGLIGHLNKGGHFRVQQGDLETGDGSWGITQMTLNITGKILLFKSLSMVSDEVLSDFQKMPSDLTFAQGVKRLKAEQEKLAHNQHSDQPAESRSAQAKSNSQ